MNAYIKKVLRITGDMKGRLPWMLALYFAALVLELIGLSLIIPFIAVLQAPETLVRYKFWVLFTDITNIHTPLGSLLALSTIIFIIYFVKTVLNIHIQRLILNFSFELQTYLRIKFARLYLEAPFLFHTKRRSNEIITILQSHISQFSKAIVGSLLRIIGEGFTLLAILAFLLISYPVPTITALCILSAFAYFYDRYVKRKVHKAGEEIIIASNDMMRWTRQGINSIKESRVLGCGEYFQQGIAESSLNTARINAYMSVVQMLPRYILEFLVVGVVIISSVFMLLMGNTGENVFESLAVFAVAAVRLLPSANQIVSNMGNLRYSRKAIEELAADLDELTALGTIPANPALSRNYQTLSLRGITFTYPGTQTRVLDNINLDMKKGEIIGISGPSGAGKSTLVDIILGLIKPDAGEFHLNGNLIPADEWTGHRLGAYIPQKPVMLDDSVAKNVALGQNDHDLDPIRVREALNRAQLADVIAALPEKEDTPVGEEAVLLSGGQRQRLALARAFYFNREIIIFDEATSALDKDTEMEILEAIKNLKKEATILIISHSEQPLQICDRICYLSQGKIEKQTGV